MSSAERFLFFDLGNVLLRFDHRRACRQLADCLGCSADRVWDVVFASGLEWDFERGLLSRHAFLDEVMARCEVTGSPNDWERAAADIFAPMEGAAAIVADVRRAGVRVGLFSNTNVVHWEFVCRRFGWIADAFEVRVLSFEIGAMKPEQCAYRSAERLCGVPRSSIVFVDDRRENVEAAMALGWDALCYRNASHLRSALAKRGLLATTGDEGPSSLGREGRDDMG